MSDGMFYYNDAGLITHKTKIDKNGNERVVWKYKFGYGEKRFYAELGKAKKGEPNELNDLLYKMTNSPDRYQWFQESFRRQA